MQIRSVVVVAALGLASSSAFAQQAVQWRVDDGGNGHWYELRMLPLGGRDWPAARRLALQIGAELASIAGESEGVFVRGIVRLSSAWNGTHGPWLGGIQSPGSSEPSGGWVWSDGTFWSYSEWGSWEPNNDCNGVPESALHLYGPWNAVFWWNDLPANQACNEGFPLSAVFEWSADCNGDGLVDYGQILNGTFEDVNSNGVPDCCDAGDSCAPCPGDITENGLVDGVDLSLVLSLWGTNGKKFPRSDTNGDGIVDATDLAVVLSGWGKCP